MLALLLGALLAFFTDYDLVGVGPALASFARAGWLSWSARRTGSPGVVDQPE